MYVLEKHGKGVVAISEVQNIRDLFDKMARRAPTPEEEARFTDTSEYYIRSYIRSLPEYNTSNEYQDRWAQIVEMHKKVFGYDPDARFVDHIIRHEMTDSQVLAGMRNTDKYKAMFAGKPEWMDESQYRKLYDEKVMKQEGVTNAFSTYAGRQLSEDELNKIFYGGPGSEAVRREYARVQSLQASREALRGQRLNTAVKVGPTGPVQQLMAGRDAAAPDTGGDTAPPATSGSWLKYEDIKNRVRDLTGYGSARAKPLP